MESLVKIVFANDLLDPVVSLHWKNLQRQMQTMCPGGCSSVLPRNYGKPVTIVVTQQPTEICYPCIMALLCHKGLADQLLPYLTGAVVGPCEDDSGTLIADYASVYTPVQWSVPLRGGQGSEYFNCPMCRSEMCYHYRGTEHVRRVDVQDREAIQLDNHGLFAVSRRLLKAIDWDSVPPASFGPLPVL